MTSNTEMAPAPAPSDSEAQPLRENSQHAEGEPKKSSGMHKPFIACFQMALAVTLFGLLAYQAQAVRTAGGGTGNQTQTSSNNATGTSTDPTGAFGTAIPALAAAGLNPAGPGMLLFGLIFAVLQAVTAAAMWTNLAFYMPHVKHSSIAGPIKVTLAVGFLAMGFACRHINLGAPSGSSLQHVRITHAIEAFIIINWFFMAVVFGLISTKVSWDTEKSVEHQFTRQHTVGYTQFFLAIILIGLLSGYFHLWTSGYTVGLTPTTDLMTGFAILFAVLQAISGLVMMQMLGMGAPGQAGETVLGLLKVTNSFGVIAFGFACRDIYVTSQATPAASAHLIAIQSFIIINFFYSLYLSIKTSHGIFVWEQMAPPGTPKKAGPAVGGTQLVFSIVLFGLIAGILEQITGDQGNTSANGLNLAGPWMVLFGLLFAVLEFFGGITMLTLSKAALLEGSVANVVNKVTLAFGSLAMGFACRHINLGIRNGPPSGAGADKTALVHAIESFIIINFFLTWAFDIAHNKGKTEY